MALYQMNLFVCIIVLLVVNWVTGIKGAGSFNDAKGLPRILTPFFTSHPPDVSATPIQPGESTHLVKRSPNEPKISHKSDHHRIMSLQTDISVDHNKKQRKWSDREQIIFNSDQEGMLGQVRLYRQRASLHSNPAQKRKASKNADFWFRKALEAAGPKARYVDHASNIQVAALRQMSSHSGNSKYQQRFHALNRNDLQAIESFERQAHIKALRAQQSTQDWQQVYPTIELGLPRPSLDEFSTPLPSSVEILQDQDRPPLDRQSSEKIERMVATRKRKAGSSSSPQQGANFIPPRGHATDIDHLLDKTAASAESPRKKHKWSSRVVATDARNNPSARAYEVIHYHNKEQRKRWKQLHLGSVAYDLRKQQAARDRQAGSSSQSSP